MRGSATDDSHGAGEPPRPSSGRGHCQAEKYFVSIQILYYPIRRLSSVICTANDCGGWNWTLYTYTIPNSSYNKAWSRTLHLRNPTYEISLKRLVTSCKPSRSSVRTARLYTNTKRTYNTYRYVSIGSQKGSHRTGDILHERGWEREHLQVPMLALDLLEYIYIMIYSSFHPSEHE